MLAGLQDLEAENLALNLLKLLSPFREEGENGAPWLAECTRQEAARCGRRLVEEVEHSRFRGDRLGECVRNLFECLEMGEEGAELALLAGENPNSVQRPI